MRIAAWAGGYRMMLDHPIFGVGLASFITALPDYYETSPRVAHNTFVQYAAESGIVAGLAYLIVVYLFFKQSFKIRAWCRKKDGSRDVERIDLYNNACTASFAGLFVCGLFLSLNTYEIFFVLLLINNCLLSLVTKEEALA
jgi:O-antigen ligase